MFNRQALIRSSVACVVAGSCVLLLTGCVDEKRVVELEQNNRALADQIEKGRQDVNLVTETLKAQQSDIAGLQANVRLLQSRLAEIQMKMTNTPAPRAEAPKSVDAQKTAAIDSGKKAPDAAAKPAAGKAPAKKQGKGKAAKKTT